MDTTENTNQLKFDKNEIRLDFYRKVCHVYQLPSGKWSNIAMWTITADEIKSLTSDFVWKDSLLATAKNYGIDFTNESEWRLWVALRLKYGRRYISDTDKNATHNQFWLPNSMYEKKEKPAQDVLQEIKEESMAIVDQAIEAAFGEVKKQTAQALKPAKIHKKTIYDDE